MDEFLHVALACAREAPLLILMKQVNELIGRHMNSLGEGARPEILGNLRSKKKFSAPSKIPSITGYVNTYEWTIFASHNFAFMFHDISRQLFSPLHILCPGIFFLEKNCSVLVKLSIKEFTAMQILLKPCSLANIFYTSWYIVYLQFDYSFYNIIILGQKNWILLVIEENYALKKTL